MGFLLKFVWFSWLRKKNFVLLSSHIGPFMFMIYLILSKASFDKFCCQPTIIKAVTLIFSLCVVCLTFHVYPLLYRTFYTNKTYCIYYLFLLFQFCCCIADCKLLCQTVVLYIQPGSLIAWAQHFCLQLNYPSS